MRWIIVLMVWTDPNPVPQITVGTTPHLTLAACNRQAIDVIRRVRIRHQDMASVRCHIR